MSTTPKLDRARDNAMRQYTKAHDRFAELEQLELLHGHTTTAIGARIYARRVLRAWLAERDDPAPEGREP